MKISLHKEATNEISKNFICANCGKLKRYEGRIYVILIPVLIVFFAYPLSNVCNECAEKFNVIGIILWMITLPIFIALLVCFVRR
jgi:hypothetical protein